MYPLALFIIAVVAALIHFIVGHGKTFTRAVELLLAYIIPLNIGIGGTIGFIGHIFYGPEIAKEIGWPPNNPFQFEVGIGNLSFAIAGLLCIWQRKGFWMATTIFAGIFFLGAAYGHLVQLAKGDTSPYNTGAFLYIGDIAIPIIYLILTFIYASHHKFFKN